MADLMPPFWVGFYATAALLATVSLILIAFTLIHIYAELRRWP